MKKIKSLFLMILFLFGITTANGQRPDMAVDKLPTDPSARLKTELKSMEDMQQSQFIDEVEENLPRILNRSESHEVNLEYNEADDLFGRDSDDSDPGDEE